MSLKVLWERPLAHLVTLCIRTRWKWRQRHGDHPESRRFFVNQDGIFSMDHGTLTPAKLETSGAKEIRGAEYPSADRAEPSCLELDLATQEAANKLVNNELV